MDSCYAGDKDYDKTRSEHRAKLDAVRSWTESESLDKQKEAFDFSGWVFASPDCPQQTLAKAPAPARSPTMLLVSD